jgi:AraC-like DNA-binding protein
MSTPHWELLDAATRGALSVLLLMLGAMLWPLRRGPAIAPVGLSIALGLLVQVVFGTPAVDAGIPRAVLTPIVGVSVANSLLFWLFARALFEDDFLARPRHALLWALVALVGGLACALCAPGQFIDAPRQGLLLLKNWLPLVFAVLALVATARHWQADLVEGRRRLRLFVIVAGVADTLMMLAARLQEPGGRVTGFMAWLDVMVLLAIAGAIAWRSLRVPDAFLPLARGQTEEAARPAPAAPAEEPADSAADLRLAADLQHAMEHDRAYKDEALSVASLARRLKAPEYRLRRVINGRLGHRNFNVYVNGYRLAEARAALASPALRDLPVLSIALEAGFGSIGPFNRAFKADTGLTPTEYRRKNLADS